MKRHHDTFYSIIILVIAFQLLGMISFLGTRTSEAKPLLEVKTMQVEKNSDTEILISSIQFEVFEEILPEPTELHELVAQYETRFDASQKNRVANIKLAARLIDGVILRPNDIFSYNEVVGERTNSRGFKVAPVIVNKKLVPGIGGGICQVSSTLYNVVLEAKLQVVERHKHGLPVNYVPPNRDATVAYNYLDFKFKNDSEDYIIIKTDVKKGRINIKMFSLR